MANKNKTKKENQWDFQKMQESLVRDHEKKITQGFEHIKSGKSGVELPVASEPAPQAPVPGVANHQAQEASRSHEKVQEPTKGVQTYIPMSMYRRLNDIKLTRRENIAALVAQAIALWLDVQEGKQKVEKL